MKKIFFFAAAAMLAVSTYAALPNYEEPVETWTVGQTAQLDEWKWNSETTHGYAVINNDWYTLSVYAISKADPKAGTPKQPWSSYTQKGTTSCEWPAREIFQGNAYYDNAKKAATANTSRVYSYKVTNMSAVSLYANSSDSSRYVCLAVLEGGVLVAADSATNKIDTILTLKGFDKTKTYTVLAYGNTSSNSNLYEIAFSISGEDPDLDPKAVAPTFSVAANTYYEPFKVGLASSKADKIYYSINDAEYVQYTDSIEISEYGKDIKVSAFSTLEGAANSDTVEAVYKLVYFSARPVFNADKEYTFAGITAEQINILTPATASLSKYVMDGDTIPSTNYTQLPHESRDSFMIVSVAGREDVTFRYKNSQNQNATMKFAADFLQMDKKGFEVWIENVKSGDTIVFVVTAKGSTAPAFDETYSSASYLNPYQPEDYNDPCYTDGMVLTTSDARVEDNYSGWQDLVYVVAEGGHSKVRIKEKEGGYRLAKILVHAFRGEDHAVDNVNATIKAVKTIENGQLVIIKNGVRYNALGAQL